MLKGVIVVFTVAVATVSFLFFYFWIFYPLFIYSFTDREREGERQTNGRMEVIDVCIRFAYYSIIHSTFLCVKFKC